MNYELNSRVDPYLLNVENIIIDLAINRIPFACLNPSVVSDVSFEKSF